MIDLQVTTMNKPRESEYYTVAEAAQLLGVSPATVWRWIEADKLLAYRVGPRGIRIKKEDLEAVIRPARARRTKVEKETKPQSIWVGYDPERVREALRRSAGALAGVDRDALLADIHGARQQASNARPG